MSPIHPYTQDLLEAVPLVGKPFRPPVKEDASVYADGLTEGCAYYNRCPFAAEKCRKQKPDLAAKEENHLVACWHA